MVGGDGGLGDLSFVAVVELLRLVVEVLAQDVVLGGADVELRPGGKVDGDLAVVGRGGLGVVVVGDLDLEGRDADLDVVLHGGPEQVQVEHALVLLEEQPEGNGAGVEVLVYEEGGGGVLLLVDLLPEDGLFVEHVVLVLPGVVVVLVLRPDLLDVGGVGLVEPVGVHLEFAHLVLVEVVVEAVLGRDPEAVEHGAAAVLSEQPDGTGLQVEVLAAQHDRQIVVLGGHVVLLDAELGLEHVLLGAELHVVPALENIE